MGRPIGCRIAQFAIAVGATLSIACAIQACRSREYQPAARKTEYQLLRHVAGEARGLCEQRVRAERPGARFELDHPSVTRLGADRFVLKHHVLLPAAQPGRVQTANFACEVRILNENTDPIRVEIQILRWE